MTENIPQSMHLQQPWNQDGFLVIDKPRGITSRDAVNVVQRLLPKRTKIGHTGTLDPLATGVLVLCIGRATKYAEVVQGMTKEYTSAFRFGATSTTDDAEGQLTVLTNAEEVTREKIQAVLPRFTGVIQQTPPAFSAIKVSGKRAYAIARAGNDVELPARPVRVDSIEILDWNMGLLKVNVVCGKGTYIRSLARDIGTALGSGAYVEELRRTRVGVFQEAMATSLDLNAVTVRAKIQPLSILN